MIRLGFICCIYRLDKQKSLFYFVWSYPSEIFLPKARAATTSAPICWSFSAKRATLPPEAMMSSKRRTFLPRKNDPSMWSVSTSSPSSSTLDEKLKAG